MNPEEKSVRKLPLPLGLLKKVDYLYSESHPGFDLAFNSLRELVMPPYANAATTVFKLLFMQALTPHPPLPKSHMLTLTYTLL